MIKIKIPERVERILNTLDHAGYEAYAVGGCVRDAILDRVPGDWDITTSAKPEQVKRLFRHCIDTGIRHGTVTVMLEGEGFEVTTYRIDGDYLDGRHPSEVFYTTQLREDLRRRDFTMNAMAYHPKKGLVDIFGGQEDMKAGIVRCVGDPLERFSEDALRILRAVRFAAQLGFSIEPGTRGALRILAPRLRQVSRERIQAELVKLLLSSHPDQICFLQENGILQEILPELAAVISAGKGEHIDRALKKAPPEKNLRLAVLFSESGEQAGKLLRGLKLDNDTIHKVDILVKWKDAPVPQTDLEVRRMLHQLGQDAFLPLMDLKDAVCDAKETTLARSIYQQVLARGDCFSLKQLAVSGQDLLDAGCQAGKSLGEQLDTLLLWVIEEPKRNERSVLLKRLEQQL